MPDALPEQPLPPAPPRRTGRRLLWGLVVLLLIALAIAVAAFRYPDVERELSTLLGGRPPAPPVRMAEGPALPPPSAVSPAVPPAGSQALVTGGLETRMALLEDRLSRLDLQAQAATGNAARAEGLLIAFAVRRTLDRGAPLGYLEDQLRLRFADAQPNAVQTLVDAGQRPATLDRLYGELAALGPRLTGGERSEGSWSKVKREVASLFVIRRVSTPMFRPEDRLEHARLLLGSGRVAEAVAEVEQLPGAGAARAWVASARRYEAIQRAIDLIETTAMLEPRRLRDGDGDAVEQLSPLAEPPGGAVPAT